jgi:hypothetical protein
MQDHKLIQDEFGGELEADSFDFEIGDGFEMEAGVESPQDELDYFDIGDLGHALGDAGHAVGSVAGQAVHAVGDVSRSIGDLAGKVPIFGSALKGLYTLTGGALFNTIDDIARGVRIDKVLLRNFESQIQSIRDVAPYVQTVISVVPGVGAGISGAISAGLALAQGKSIDQAMIDAAVGAIPGGPLAQTALKIGVAAAQGKPIADAAIDALPIPPVAKDGAKAAFHVMQDVAQGKRVDRALLAEADKQIQNLPPELRKAAQVGIALGKGKKLQDIAKQEIPGLVGIAGPLATIGQSLAQVDPIIARARQVAGRAVHGFDVAAGLMKHRPSALEFAHARNALPIADRKGFDRAVALLSSRLSSHAGMRLPQVPSRTAPRPAARPGYPLRVPLNLQARQFSPQTVNLPLTERWHQNQSGCWVRRGKTVVLFGI